MLGMALSRSRQEKVWQSAIDATWLMIVTGWQRGEVLGLRWSEIDLPRRRRVPTGPERCASLGVGQARSS